LAIDECGSIHPFALMAKPNRFTSDQSRVTSVTVNGQVFTGASHSRILKLEQDLRDGRICLTTEAERAVLKAKGLI
jgi:hypothetical protein